MSKFYFIEFKSKDDGQWHIGTTCQTLRVARKRLAWYSKLATEARIMQGGQGGLKVAA